MTTATKSAPTKSRAKPTPSHKAPDAIALLIADHRGVSDLFEEYEKAKSNFKKKQIVSQICSELTLHARIEEEIFYPAVKLALDDKELIPEAEVEHASMKAMIVQIEGVEPDGEEYEAKVNVLHEYVKHHVKEEESEMFSKAKSSSMDLADLAVKLAQRKAELRAERA